MLARARPEDGFRRAFVSTRRRRGMRRRFRTSWALVVPVVVGLLLAGGVPASAAGTAHGSIVSATPSARTPQILDGRVTDLEEVGNRIVVTGTFTQVQNVAVNGGNILNRNKVFAFDPGTGAVDTAFVPSI